MKAFQHGDAAGSGSNPDKLLLPGMFMRATLQQGERPDGLLVPQAAVARTPRGGATVLIVDNQHKVEQRDIQISQSQNGNWVVESGLKAGERVIVAGLQKVRAGAEVAPKKSPLPPSQSVGWSSRLMARFFIDRTHFRLGNRPGDHARRQPLHHGPAHRAISNDRTTRGRHFSLPTREPRPRRSKTFR